MRMAGWVGGVQARPPPGGSAPLGGYCPSRPLQPTYRDPSHGSQHPVQLTSPSVSEGSAVSAHSTQGPMVGVRCNCVR